MLAVKNTIDSTSTGSTFLNRLGWFVGLNSVCLLLALVAIWMGWRSFTLTTSGAVAEGTVVRLLEDEVSFTSDFTPIIEFQLDGQTYEVQSQNTYRWWDRYLRFPVGKQVEVIYNPANPESAEINSWWDIWNETIILSVFTILAAIAVNLYLIFRWRKAGVVHASV